MHPIVYFDLSIGGTRIPLANGTQTSLEVLLRLTADAYPEEFAKYGYPRALVDQRFEPTRHWQNVIKALVLAISGRRATRHDMKNLRRLMYKLPHWYKWAYKDVWYPAGMIAYIIVGFRMHPGSHHKEDSNVIDDVVRFASSLVMAENMHVTSFLCSHRGPSIPGGSWLADDIPQEDMRRALHLQRALLENAFHLDTRSITWIQQEASPFAAGSLFPELFLRYAERGNVSTIIAKLASHERQVTDMLSAQSGNMACHLERLDASTHAIRRHMRRMYGSGWSRIDFSAIQWSPDPLWEIAMEDALPEIKRLMPYFADGEKFRIGDQRAWVAKNLEQAASAAREYGMDPAKLERLTRSTLRWFLACQNMHPSAKAMYEAAFYYLWGRRCGSVKDWFAIGLDRDHSRYQRDAWMLGYRHAAGISSESSVLYARRIDRPREADPFLNTLSFRQFWR